MDAGESSSGSKMRRGERSPSPNPASRLTDDLLLEILSRVPHRSLCRFRCVSKHWRALISHPDHRRTLPQSLVGFFHPRTFAIHGGVPPVPAPTGYCFTNVSGTGRPFIDPSFPFLPDREREHLVLVDGCSSLLLCRCYRFPDPEVFDYLVLNPAREEWVAVPGSRRWSSRLKMVRLGLDPSVSPHFYLFEFDVDIEVVDGYEVGSGHVLGVKIYASATGVWGHKQSGWSVEITLNENDDVKSVFLSGMLYVIASEEGMIGAVDVEGKTWRIIACPVSKRFITNPGFIDLSQGRLHFASVGDKVYENLTIWVLEDNDGEEWTLKHKVCNKHLVGQKHFSGFHLCIVVAVHPERNIIFFLSGYDGMLMSYDMDSGEVCSILEVGNIAALFIPYVHMFSKALADGNRCC